MIPSDEAGQVQWIADQARAGHGVTARLIAERFEAAGHALSLSTVKRRLARARREHPDAFAA